MTCSMPLLYCSSVVALDQYKKYGLIPLTLFISLDERMSYNLHYPNKDEIRHIAIQTYIY